MAQTGPVSYSVEAASGGKWKRRADQIHSSNIPIQQDTDVQLNKPILKPAIIPHDSYVPNVGPLATPMSSGNSAVPPVLLEPRYPFRNILMTCTKKLPKHS